MYINCVNNTTPDDSCNCSDDLICLYIISLYIENFKLFEKKTITNYIL